MTPLESDTLIARLPQRPPFLFVDAVEECVPAVRVRARYRVTGDEEFLQGHFPDNPILPGVILIEALAQAASLALATDPRYEGKLALFGGVEKARFRRVVRPGDELLLTAEVERLSARGGWSQVRASVDDVTACEARLFFAIG